MKSRISFFDKTVFLKAVTRFSPLWALYFIGGTLLMLTFTDSTGNNAAYYTASNVALTIGYFAVINMVYAGLCAQLLFGDLFNSRLCNALHAMPMRRETWFFTHVLAGVAFSFVPNFLGILPAVVRMEQFWYVGAIWLLGMTLQYVFFFGLAVLSMFCTGNRIAMVAVYGILNFAAMIALWFCKTVYEPLLYGVFLPTEPFFLLCPAAWLCRQEEYVLWRWGAEFHAGNRVYYFDGFGEGWMYMAVLCVIGIVLLAVSLLMYRRRRLESAGDFMAVRPLAPVFLVVYTLCVGALFAMFGELTNSVYLPYLLLGLAIGFFTGQMLLQRKVKVFYKKSFLGFGIFVAALAITLLAVRLDPFGVTRWTPQEGQVESVTIGDRNFTNYDWYSESRVVIEDPAQIQKLIALHKQAIASGKDVPLYDQTRNLYLSYKLRDGRTVNRSYNIAWLKKDTREGLRFLCSTPEAVFGKDYVNRLVQIEIDGYPLSKELSLDLLSAMEKDCLAGNMAHAAQYHDDWSVKLWVTMRLQPEQTNVEKIREIRLYGDAEHTLAWLVDHAQVWFTEDKYGNASLEDFLDLANVQQKK